MSHLRLTFQLAAAIGMSVLLLPVSASAADPIFETSGPASLILEKGAGEGPAWHPELGILFSGNGGTGRLSLSGRQSMFRADVGTNGLLFDSMGRLVCCEAQARRVTRVSAAGQVTVLATEFEGMKFNQPNDLTIDSKGRIYFSDPQYGPRDTMEMKDQAGRLVEGVYRIDLNGTVIRVITHEVDRPNGLVITPDDKWLYVAGNNNNEAGGARRLWRFAMHADGTVNLNSRKLLFDWKDGRGPDGMVLDRQGRILVAGGLNDSGRSVETDRFKAGVYVFSPLGKLLQIVSIPRDEVTNCTFGGKDMKTLYVTAGGTLWSIRTRTAGRVVWPDAALQK